MNILSIDSSGLVASAALMSDHMLVAEYTIHNKKTHSQTLLPMISDMMKMADIEPGKLDAIAVSAGPGSFTGLRIGAATAKGLAWTLKIPIIPVSSLMGLAMNVPWAKGVVCPVMDARRNQAYYGIYRMIGGIPQIVAEPDVDSVDRVIERVNELGEAVSFLGDGVPVFEEEIRKKLRVEWMIPEKRLIYQNASAVAELGTRLYEAGSYVAAQDFAPVYLRKSQAEREREAALRVGNGTTA